MKVGKSPQARLLQLVAIEKNDLWVALVYSAGIGVLTLALPVATQSLVNTIALGNLLQPLVVLSLIVLATYALSAALQGLRIWVVEVLQRRILVRITSDTINRILRAPASAFESHHGPELLNRFFDVVTLQKSGSTLLVDGLGVVMQSLIGMVLLGLYHPWLLAFDFLLLAAIVLVIFPLGSGAVRTSVDESKAKYALVAWLQETARHSTAFRHPDAMRYATARTNDLVTDYLTNRSGHFRILLRQILGTFGIHAVASASLLGVGGWLVIQRELTLGQLVAAEIVVQLVLSGFTKLGKHLELYYDLAAAIDKLGYLQDLPLERVGPEAPAWDGPASVRLSEVGFSYPGRPELLREVNLVARPGERVALTAHSGAGKSTLFDLLYLLREPTSGSLEIQGVEARDMNRSRLRESVALVRHAEIFEGSVADNIRMGRAVDSARIRTVLGAVGLLDQILEMPGGLDSRLATGGLPLSSGQVTRLIIARAIVGDPKLLLVDEALDHSADTPEFQRLADTLFAPGAPWTLVVASSHRSLIDRCDSVYRIDNSSLARIR